MAESLASACEAYRELADSQLRETLGPELEENIGLAIGRQLTDQGFDSRDRPGRPPGWLDEVVAGDPAEVVRLSASHPGCFTLPAPPEREREQGELSWDRVLRNWFHSKAGRPSHWGMALFGEPLVLDIAVCGGAAPRHDLDNLAHRVGAAFRRAYPAAGRLGGYRVYRVGGGDAEVRVRVVPLARFQPPLLPTEDHPGRRTRSASDRSARNFARSRSSQAHRTMRFRVHSDEGCATSSGSLP
jgi:hypothetical protein